MARIPDGSVLRGREDVENGLVPKQSTNVLDHKLLEEVFLSHASSTKGDPEEEPFVVADMGEVYRLYRRWQAYLPRVRPFYGAYQPSQYLSARMPTQASCQMQPRQGCPQSLEPTRGRIRLLVQKRNGVGVEP